MGSDICADCFDVLVSELQKIEGIENFDLDNLIIEVISAYTQEIEYELGKHMVPNFLCDKNLESAFMKLQKNLEIYSDIHGLGEEIIHDVLFDAILPYETEMKDLLRDVSSISYLHSLNLGSGTKAFA